MSVEKLASLAKIFSLIGIGILIVSLVIGFSAVSTLFISSIHGEDFDRTEGGSYRMVIEDPLVGSYQISIISNSGESIEFEMVIRDRSGNLLYDESGTTPYSDIFDNDEEEDIIVTFRIITPDTEMDDLTFQIMESGFGPLGFCCLGSLFLLLALGMGITGIVLGLVSLAKYAGRNKAQRYRVQQPPPSYYYPAQTPQSYQPTPYYYKGDENLRRGGGTE